jgi:hypothetical protein
LRGASMAAMKCRLPSPPSPACAAPAPSTQHPAPSTHLVPLGVGELRFFLLHAGQVHALTRPPRLVHCVVGDEVLELAAHKGAALARLDVQELCREWRGRGLSWRASVALGKEQHMRTAVQQVLGASWENLSASRRSAATHPQPCTAPHQIRLSFHF